MITKVRQKGQRFPIAHTLLSVLVPLTNLTPNIFDPPKIVYPITVNVDIFGYWGLKLTYLKNGGLISFFGGIKKKCKVNFFI